MSHTAETTQMSDSVLEFKDLDVKFRTEFGRVHAVTLTSSAGTVVHTTPLTAVPQGIVDACGVPAPPRVTHLHPA